MSKKKLLGLILFANFIIAGMFLASELLIYHSNHTGTKTELGTNGADTAQNAAQGNTQEKKSVTASQSYEASTDEKSVTDATAPTKMPEEESGTVRIEEATAGFASDITAGDSLSTSTETTSMPQLIYDSSQTDYLSYIPELIRDDELNAALNINNPDISIDAESAILFDASTKQVLYYKNPVQAAFPASTLKLLTSIVALEWCSEEEEVSIGDEINLIAPDSTKAYLKQGEILTIKSLLEAMLLPSGNDAAYAVAAYVGRKALDNPDAKREEAVTKFIQLMNDKAKELGVKNSCFKTPDGYDAIGQYTTAYDMGLIGIAAAGNNHILEVAGQGKARTTFVSGQDVTWKNTNKLVKRYSGEYYSKAIGLKTGTSTMAGRCIIAAARSDNKEVVCVILDSTAAGRWEDAIRLLEYGLEE